MTGLNYNKCRGQKKLNYLLTYFWASLWMQLCGNFDAGLTSKFSMPGP